MAGVVGLINNRPSSLNLWRISSYRQFSVDSNAPFSFSTLNVSQLLSLAPCSIVLWQWENQAERNIGRRTPNWISKSQHKTLLGFIQLCRIPFSKLVLRVRIIPPRGHLPPLVTQPLGHIRSGAPWGAHLWLTALMRESHSGERKRIVFLQVFAIF